jgi:hypothetical protein
MTLAAFDRIFAGHAVAVALTFPEPLDGGQLAAALERATGLVPGLAGRLETAAGTVPDDLADPGALADLVPPLAGGTVAARLTAGRVLAVTMAHQVVDGFSFFAFLRAWSRLAAGQPARSLPSDRNVFSAGGGAPPTPDELWRRTGFTWIPGHPWGGRSGSFGARVALPELTQVRGLSLNDLVCAALVQRFGLELAGADGLFLTMPVDCRRLLPGVPQGYFGNAVRAAPLLLDRDALSEGVPELAARVQAAVKRANDEAGARDALSCLESLPDGAWADLHLVHPDAGLLITNVSRLPFEMLDFGAGPPDQAFLPVAEPRTAVIQRRDDSIDVSILLP